MRDISDVLPLSFGDTDESGFGMSDAEMDRRMRGLVELSIAKMKLLGLPVCRYEEETGRVYYEYPDGGREYVTRT